MDERRPLLSSADELNIFQFFILGFTAAVCNASTDMYIPMLASIKRELSASVLSISLSLTVNWLLNGFSGPFWALLATSRFFRRKGALSIGILLFMFGTIISGTAVSAVWLIIGRSIQGLGEGSAYAVAEIILSDIYIDTDKRNDALANLSSTYPLVIIAAPIIGGFIGAYFGWRAIFVFLFFWGLVVLILSITFLPETFYRFTGSKLQIEKDDAAQQDENLSFIERANSHLQLILKVIQNKRVRAGILFNYSTNGLIGTMLSYYPYTLKIQYGHSPQSVGLILGSFGITCFLGAITNSLISKALAGDGTRKVYSLLRAGAIVYIILTLIILFAAISLFPSTAIDDRNPFLSFLDSFPFSYAFFASETFLIFFNYPCIFAIMFEGIDESDALRPTAVGMNSGAQVIGFGTASLLVGLFSQITEIQLGSSKILYSLLAFWSFAGLILLFSFFTSNTRSALYPTDSTRMSEVSPTHYLKGKGNTENTAKT